MIGAVCGIRVFSEMNPEMDFIIVPHEEQLLSDIQPIISEAYETWWQEDPCEPIGSYIVSVLAERGYDVDLFPNQEWRD